MKKITNRANLEQTEIIEQMPEVCSNELAAVEFFERRIWNRTPRCPHCQSTNVYQMKDAKTGQRSQRFLWRCHACEKQFTIRVGTVLEESRIPLRHWAYAFWRAVASKKGVSALEIQRQCQISYPSALFLMHRIRLAMTPEPGTSPKLGGLGGMVECDETYIGGKPRHVILPRPGKHGPWPQKIYADKTPVFGMVERGGRIHRRVIASVSGKNLKDTIRECVDPSATISTDQLRAYRGIGKHFDGGHVSVNHTIKQYVRGQASTNTAESSFALLKRGLMGIYHAVSKKHLHRYVGEFDFRWNTRNLNDGERTVAAVQGAIGKRLDHETLTR
ncbi:MAG: IS1595 family transposase [Verrucomicrobiota bacterium]|jgi:transposase-like protein